MYCSGEGLATTGEAIDHSGLARTGRPADKPIRTIGFLASLWCARGCARWKTTKLISNSAERLRKQTRNRRKGAVKLSKRERRKPDLAPFSGGSDGRAPRFHGRCSKGPARFCRGEMALDVEGILTTIPVRAASARRLRSDHGSQGSACRESSTAVSLSGARRCVAADAPAPWLPGWPAQRRLGKFILQIFHDRRRFRQGRSVVEKKAWNRPDRIDGVELRRQQTVRRQFDIDIQPFRIDRNSYRSGEWRTVFRIELHGTRVNDATRQIRARQPLIEAAPGFPGLEN